MTHVQRKHVAVGLSGGVDSAVSAWLLRRQGYRVTAIFMKNWEEDDRPGYCAAAEDHQMAQAVCAHLGIELRAINFAAEYWEQVFRYFLADLAAGRTPNPDVLCNREIKFRALLDYARGLGAEVLATGHYARVAPVGGRTALLKGCDPEKDQSYFLYMLGQDALGSACFPVGELTKREVRALARRSGLPNHARKDSTGICFIGERRFKTFLERYLRPRPGEIRSVTGERKGEHDGLGYYTIGQRHGLGIGGPGGPWFVVAKDSEHNLLYVAPGHDHPALYATALAARDLHWMAGSAPPLPLECRAKIRYRGPEASCRLDASSAGGVRVSFARPQRAITPGQAVVFYAGDVCLGGGTIAMAVDRASAASGAARVAQR